MNEIDQFFNDLPSEDKQVQDVFNEVKPEVVPAKDEPKEDEDAEGYKNRRHRRLEDKLQKEREANIALSERVKALSEAQQFIKQTQTESKIDPRLARVFGNTDEGKEVASTFSEILAERTKEAKEEALREFEARQEQTLKQQKDAETLIDNGLEALEDQYNVDLTSDAPAARKSRREFLELVGKLSPKDADGTIIDYADFNSAFELYQGSKTNTKPEVVNRAKEIAAKSMQSSAPVDTTKGNDDAEIAYLRSIGIKI